MIFSSDAVFFTTYLSLTTLFLSHSMAYVYDVLSFQHALAVTKMAAEQAVWNLLYSEGDWVCRYSNGIYVPACVWMKNAKVIRNDIMPPNFKCEVHCDDVSLEAFIGCNDGIPSGNTPVYTVNFRVCVGADGSDPATCSWHECNLEVWK